jgi:FKBP-type peptidyl-prolyl cis-trans isomerase 2
MTSTQRDALSSKVATIQASNVRLGTRNTRIVEYLKNRILKEQNKITTLASKVVEANNAKLTVTLDSNPPLAGEALTYDVEIIKIIKVRGNGILGKIQNGDIVDLHYVATKSNGEVVATTRNSTKPLTIIV